MEMFNLPRKAAQEAFKITRAHWVAIQQKFCQSLEGAEPFTEFCHRVKPALGINRLMLPWCRMLAGN
jgi:hypothetical protein